MDESEKNKSGKGLVSISEKLGEFIAKAIGEPVEEASGLLADRIRFMRWEQQIRLVDRCKEIARNRGIEGKETPAPTKSVLPLLEAASLESEPELEELWAQLLTSYVDPQLPSVRTGYVEIVKQLEAVDANILKICYNQYKNKLEGYMNRLTIFASPVRRGPTTFGIQKSAILAEIDIDDETYETAVDNLVRVNCLSHFIDEEYLSLDTEEDSIDTNVSVVYEYHVVCMTSLGLGFAKACDM
ncbi:MAG: Abi-alpha family protein [Candidatus Thiodiazotropha sp. L084R]